MNAKAPACIITRVIHCLTGLSALSIVLGTFLCWKGYSGGDVLLSLAGNLGSGLGGVIGGYKLANRMGTHPTPQSLEISTTGNDEPQTTTATVN